MITNSNLLIYGFLQNGQPVYITAPSSVTGTQIQLSPINYPTLNHLPDLSPMRMNNRFPESWANDPDFPSLPQMEDCNENLSAINPFVAEGIIANSMSQCSSPRQNHSPNTSKVQNYEKRSQSVNNAHQLLQKEYIPDYEIFPIAVKVSLNENGKQFPEDSKVFKFLTNVVGHKMFAFEILSKIPKMVIHVDSNNTAEKLLSLNSICDQNVSIELQEKISRDIDKANAAAEHLASIVSVEDPFVEEAIAQKSKVKRMSQMDNNTQYNSPFSLHELTTVIKSLLKTSPGDDGIYPHFIQNLPIDWVQILLGIINETWDHGLFPKSWKDGTVKLIPKQGKDKSKIENYRTITLLPVAGKIYERLVKQRLITMIEINKGLQDIQYGFRKGRNTDDIMFMFLNDALYALENKKVLVAVFLDVKAAFETMVHRQILDGVLEAKIRGRLLAFSLSFLEDRDMKVEKKAQRCTRTPDSESGNQNPLSSELAGLAG
ncbi:hypothetical protein QYM36_007236 [Artemia franciscana]|uniref:Reverse transcriptase domain-containing protein n=1 Tax=Artemia franciscana TaxID=6661 RepID=A0AA88I7Z2_ARTSF|nr:hypothetical protein QYM36_007236 [Artemia franciscana]